MAIQVTKHAGEADAPQGAGLLQANSLAGSAPNESVLYSPIARRPYIRDPHGRSAPADLPAGLATPQTPRSVSRDQPWGRALAWGQITFCTYHDNVTGTTTCISTLLHIICTRCVDFAVSRGVAAARALDLQSAGQVGFYCHVWQ